MFLPVPPLLLALPLAVAPTVQQPPVRLPDLEGAAWLNTDRPLASWREDLRGQVVLLDFWTYCCINCMHVLPDLAALEEEFRDEPFLVIGVHSNKFPQEGEVANVRQAVLRYRIRHPVVVDTGRRLWSRFGVRSWPTLVLVDPEGREVGRVAGEGHREALRTAIRDLLAEHREKGTLAPGPLELRREAADTGELRYPGKVLVHGGRLYVADSGHGRVLAVAPADGSILGRYGEGVFRDPQGLAVLGEHLYVADPAGHAIFRVDLGGGEGERVAGTGEQASWRPGAGPAREVRLNSPWDLAADGERLHVAMAGSHQLWTLDLEGGKVLPLAGSGREGLVDGPAESAWLAQPSGLAIRGRRLYLADSEVSAVRVVDLEAGTVDTLVGTGLFDFGHRDGPFGKARLQHPLGLAWWRDRLLVADTYNNKVKALDLAAGRVETVAGTGEEELRDGVLTFWEPGGLAVDGDTLYVADTNHHRVVAVELPGGKWRVVLGGR